MTVLLSSHLLSEIDQMASFTGIIDHGKMIFQGELDELHMHSQKSLALRTLDNQAACRILSAQGISCKNKGGCLLFPALSDEHTARLISSLVSGGVGLLRVEEQQKTLEEIFLSLTGKQVNL